MDNIKCKCGSINIFLDISNKCNEEGEDYYDWAMFCIDCRLDIESYCWGEYDYEEIQNEINEYE